MTDEDRDDDRERTVPLDFVDIGGFDLPGTGVLDDLGDELQAGIAGATPDAADIEETLSGVSLPGGPDLDVDTRVIPDASLDAEQVDRVVDAGGEAVEVAVEGTGEAGTVLVETGGEVVEIAVEGGGEAAAEATGEIVAAALDGI